MKMEQYTVFVLQNKLLKNRLVLLLLSNFKNSHCVLVKYFNTFMTNTRKHHGKKHFVNIAYNAFLAQEN